MVILLLFVSFFACSPLSPNSQWYIHNCSTQVYGGSLHAHQHQPLVLRLSRPNLRQVCCMVDLQRPGTSVVSEMVLIWYLMQQVTSMPQTSRYAHLFWGSNFNNMQDCYTFRSWSLCPWLMGTGCPPRVICWKAFNKCNPVNWNGIHRSRLHAWCRSWWSPQTSQVSPVLGSNCARFLQPGSAPKFGPISCRGFASILADLLS